MSDEGERLWPGVKWGTIPGSKLAMRQARPNSEDTANFDCSDPDSDQEPAFYEASVNSTVRKAKWATNPNVIALEFVYGKDVVGYAFAVNQRKSHPDSSAADKAFYQLVFTAGVNGRFRGKKPRNEGETFAEIIFRAIELLPREVVVKGKVVGRTVGIYLEVYEENERALGFYRKLGFIEDPQGAQRDPSGHNSIVMRKLFDEA